MILLVLTPDHAKYQTGYPDFDSSRTRALMERGKETAVLVVLYPRILTNPLSILPTGSGGDIIGHEYSHATVFGQTLRR
jgi:hypothetical protein